LPTTYGGATAEGTVLSVCLKIRVVDARRGTTPTGHDTDALTGRERLHPVKNTTATATASVIGAATATASNDKDSGPRDSCGNIPGPTSRLTNRSGCLELNYTVVPES
jgi:hypothetical protein